MNIIDESRGLLEISGYKTKYSELEANFLYFEDDSLLGFVISFSTTDNLLKYWKEKSDKFLMKNADRLRSNPRKAWNIYSIFLTTEEPASPIFNELLEIEDNLQSSRKIARSNIKTREDLLYALYPIIPIQNRVVLQPENFIERVRDRISLGERTLTAFLGASDAEEVANFLIEEK